MYCDRNQIRTFVFFLMILLAAGFAEPAPTLAQDDIARMITEFEEGVELRDRVGAVRGVAAMVMRRQATADERVRVLGFLKQNTSHEDPVVRLAAYTELLKIASAEKDSELGKLAMQGASDENINVRRGLMKYFRTFYSGRFEVGRDFRDLLLPNLEDDDLEMRYQTAAVMHSWGISNNKIVDIMLDSLDLANYRAATIYSLVSAEPNRKSTIDKIVQRLKDSEHNAAEHINLLSLLMPQSQPAIGEVLKYYSNDRPQIRMAVVDAIGRMNGEPEASVGVLQQALKDPAPQVRRMVLLALVRLETEDGVLKDAVLQQLGDEDEKVAEVAGKSLGFYDGKFNLILPELQKILKGDDKDKIAAVLTGFVSCGPAAGEATSDVVKLLEHEDYETQVRACWALIEMGPEHGDEVVAGLNTLLASEPDERVYVVALQALSQFDTSDEQSKRHLQKYLGDSNQFARYASLYGLQKSITVENAEQILKMITREVNPRSSQLSEFDNLIIESLVNGGEPVAEIVKKFLDDEDPYVKSRALRVVSRSKLTKQEEIRSKIIDALSDEVPFVGYAAAVAISEFEQIDEATLAKIFALTDVNQRQRTADVLRLIGQLGSRANPITGTVAGLMNGDFRGRYTNDAKKTIVDLGEYATDALPVLIQGKPTIPKFECIQAIGSKDEAAATMLREYLNTVEARIAGGKNENLISFDRRGRLFAATALAVTSGDPAMATKTIREELNTELRPFALRLIAKAYKQDDSLIDDVIGFLPDKQAIATLAEIGGAAKRSLEKLKELSKNTTPEVANAAKRAIWLIEDSPELAMQTIDAILNDNRSQAVELRLEDRQQMWDVLRFLATKHASNAEVEKVLTKIERSRFSNLRNFVKDLRLEMEGRR